MEQAKRRAPLVRVDGQDRVWLLADPTIELVPSHKAWRRGRSRAYWHCRRGRKILGPWRLTVALAIAAADL